MKPSTYILGGSVLAAGLYAVFGSSKTPPKPTQPTPTPVLSGKCMIPTTLVPGDHIWFWNGLICSNQNIPQQDWFGTSTPNDYANHGHEIYYFVIYENEIKRGQPHMRGAPGSYSWLHNNPGNITGLGPGKPDSKLGEYLGKYGWHNFLIFPTYEIGFDAIQKYLHTNPIYTNLNIVQSFNKYAPKGDGGNDPDRYAAEVANAAGINILTPIQSLTVDQMKLVQEKIAQIEGYVPGTSLTYAQAPPQIQNLITHPDLV